MRYRAITDNGDEVPWEPKVSGRPLTMSQIIGLIDGAGQGTEYWSEQLGCGVDPSDLPSFFVESSFYPQLHDYYEECAGEWMQGMDEGHSS